MTTSLHRRLQVQKTAVNEDVQAFCSSLLQENGARLARESELFKNNSALAERALGFLTYKQLRTERQSLDAILSHWREIRGETLAAAINAQKPRKDLPETLAMLASDLSAGWDNNQTTFKQKQIKLETEITASISRSESLLAAFTDDRLTNERANLCDNMRNITHELLTSLLGLADEKALEEFLQDRGGLAKPPSERLDFLVYE